jgi:hypothetical protein
MKHFSRGQEVPITSEAVMAMAEKFNTGQGVCLQIPSDREVMQVKEGTS